MGFFSSSALQVSVTSDHSKRVVAGQFVQDDNSVHIEMPQFPPPPGGGSMRTINATVRITMNGVHYSKQSMTLSITVGATFKIGYLYVGPVDDFGAVRYALS